MSDAMRQIKEALGDEAIIVSSKESAGGWIRVTAAVEHLNPEPEKLLQSLKKEDRHYDDDTMTDMITDALLKHRVPSSVSDKIISSAAAHPLNGPRETLARALEYTFSFKELQGKKHKPIVLVGPPGAGKTLMTAKLAAEAVLNGERPAVITTDIARAGGIEQLSSIFSRCRCIRRKTRNP